MPSLRFSLNVGFFAAAIVFATIPAANGQLAARKADEWVTTLEGAQRIASSKIDEVIAKLALKPGMIVADIGAGSGLFARPLSKAIGNSGKLYAVDVQQDLLDFIGKRARDEKIANIQTVLGEFDDPKIPARNVDLAFINDVLHHIQNRAVYLKALGTYIKPGGRIALIEMDSTDANTPHRAQPELLVSRADIMQWMSAAGFRLVEEHAGLFPGTKWFLVFGK